MKIWKHCVLFYLGGAAYMFLEFAWRGHSHPSMFLLGGVCFLAIGGISKLRLSLSLRLLICSAGITFLELITGLLVNRGFQVWDYRAMPLNFLGQVCLPYSLLWIPVSLGGMHLYRAATAAIA